MNLSTYKTTSRTVAITCNLAVRNIMGKQKNHLEENHDNSQAAVTDSFHEILANAARIERHDYVNTRLVFKYETHSKESSPHSHKRWDTVSAVWNKTLPVFFSLEFRQTKKGDRYFVQAILYMHEVFPSLDTATLSARGGERMLTSEFRGIPNIIFSESLFYTFHTKIVVARSYDGHSLRRQANASPEAPNASCGAASLQSVNWNNLSQYG